MIRLLSLLLLLLMPSCGLVRLPFRLAGGAIKGTASLTRQAIDAPGKAKRRRERQRETDADDKTDESDEPLVNGQSPTPTLDQALPDFSSDLPAFPADPLPTIPPVE